MMPPTYGLSEAQFRIYGWLRGKILEDLPGLDEARLSPDTSVRELGMAPGEWDDLVARMMEALGVRPAPSELRNAARLRDVAVLFSEHLTA